MHNLELIVLYWSKICAQLFFILENFAVFKNNYTLQHSWNWHRRFLLLFPVGRTNQDVFSLESVGNVSAFYLFSTIRTTSTSLVPSSLIPSTYPMRNSLLPAFQKQRSRFIGLGAFPSPSRISLSLARICVVILGRTGRRRRTGRGCVLFLLLDIPRVTVTDADADVHWLITIALEEVKLWKKGGGCAPC